MQYGKSLKQTGQARKKASRMKSSGHSMCRVHARASKTGDQCLRLLRSSFSSLEAVMKKEMGEHDTLPDSERWHAGTPQDKVGASGPICFSLSNFTYIS